MGDAIEMAELSLYPSHLTHLKKNTPPSLLSYQNICQFYYDFSFSISHKKPYFYMTLQRFSNAQNTEVKLLWQSRMSAFEDLSEVIKTR